MLVSKLLFLTCRGIEKSLWTSGRRYCGSEEPESSQGTRRLRWKLGGKPTPNGRTLLYVTDIPHIPSSPATLSPFYMQFLLCYWWASLVGIARRRTRRGWCRRRGCSWSRSTTGSSTRGSGTGSRRRTCDSRSRRVSPEEKGDPLPVRHSASARTTWDSCSFPAGMKLFCTRWLCD